MTGNNVSLDRRQVLRAGGAAGLAFGLGHQALGAPGLVERIIRRDGPAKSLVLVQLGGGNDGLATVVPHGEDALYRARKTTARRKKDLLPLRDDRGLHPGLERLHAQFGEGRLAIVEGCGYPNPVRSHFKSYEIWHTAREAGRVSGDGWIGRLQRAAFAEEARPDSVVHMGGRAPYSLHSQEFPPIALASPTGYRWFGDEEVYGMAGEELCEHEPRETRPKSEHAGRDRALRALRATLDDATESSARVRRAAASYRTTVTYPKSRMAASLRDIAALIEGGVGARVYSIAKGGFDTHTGQRSRHDALVSGIDAALGAFLEDLGRSEAGRNTVVMIFSEFGRRVAENGSKGHDHGKAAPVMLWGHGVRGGLHGVHPSLDDLDRGDLAFTTDFRSVYATLVQGLFGADPRPVLGAEYPELDLLG